MEHQLDGHRGPSVPNQRKVARITVQAEATLRRDGSNSYGIHVFDISLSGCRVEIVERPGLGEGVWVKFDGLEPLHAIVRWVEGPIAGVEFEKPFHPAVFDLLLKRLG